MTAPLIPDRASELQGLLAQLTGHAAARVRRYGKYLLIQMQHDNSLDTVARLTQTGTDHYTAAFRTHSGRWEPLPAAGNLRQTAEIVVTILVPYLDPDM